MEFSAGYIRNAIIWSTPENRATSYWSNIFTFGRAISSNQCKIKFYLKNIKYIFESWQKMQALLGKLGRESGKINYNLIESVSIYLHKVFDSLLMLFFKSKASNWSSSAKRSRWWIMSKSWRNFGRTWDRRSRKNFLWRCYFFCMVHRDTCSQICLN